MMGEEVTLPMSMIEVQKNKLEWIARENKAVFAATVEVDKVLNWYRDHPHYPLDYDKVKEKIAEAHTRLEGIATMLNELVKTPEKTKEDFSADVWL
jgi:hypothetical protein